MWRPLGQPGKTCEASVEVRFPSEFGVLALAVFWCSVREYKTPLGIDSAIVNFGRIVAPSVFGLIPQHTAALQSCGEYNA